MKAEAKFSLLFFVIVFILFLQTFKNPIFQDGGDIGAGYFPFFISLITLILLLIYLGTLIIELKKRGKEEDVKKRKGVGVAQLFLIILTLLSILAAKYIGILVTMGVFLLLTFSLIEKIPWKKSIILSLISVLSIYLIFEKWLGLNLPSGILI